MLPTQSDRYCGSMARPKKPSKLLLFGCSFATSNRGVSALAHASTTLLIERSLVDVVAAFPSRSGDSDGEQTERFAHLGASSLQYRLSPFAHVSNSALWALVLAILYRLIPLRSVRTALARSNKLVRELHSALVPLSLPSFALTFGATSLGSSRDNSTILQRPRRRRDTLWSCGGTYET